MQEKKILFISIALLAFLALLPVVMAGEVVLFLELARPALEQDPAVSNAQLIEVHWEALNKGHNKEITLKLFDGKKVTAVRDRLDQPSPDSYVWIGHIRGTAGSAVTLSVVDSVLVGSITLDGYEQYRIADDGPGQILRQIDHGLITEVESIDMVQPPSLPDGPTEEGAYCEDGSQIDLLVAYTKRARQQTGGTAAIRALINQRVSDMNSANANSRLGFRYRLAHTMETNYQETGDVAVDLPRLKETSDGVLDDVAAARDAHKADLTSLIISEAQLGSGCGMAYVMNEMSTNFASYAYNIVALDYAGNNLACNPLTLAHEFGHNMGNQHNRSANSFPPLLPYAFGYQSPQQTFRTIMAYNCPGGCPRINQWSNPDISVAGEALGISHDLASSQSADNARSLELTARHVANFRENCTAAVGPAPTATPPPGALPTETPPASSAPYGYKSYAPIVFTE